MKGFIGNIEKQVKENTNFRTVLYTSQHCQLVVMDLKPLEEIGMEIHPDNDQFIRVELGRGKVIINGVENLVSDGSAVIIPAGAEHNVINTSTVESLKLYTLYSPPHHKDGTVHITKEDAVKSDEDFDGVTTE